MEKIFGPSWKTSLGGVVAFVGGLGAIVSHTAIGATPTGIWIESLSELALLAGGAFGLISAKDKNVSNSPTPLESGHTVTNTKP